MWDVKSITIAETGSIDIRFTLTMWDVKDLEKQGVRSLRVRFTLTMWDVKEFGEKILIGKKLVLP